MEAFLLLIALLLPEPSHAADQGKNGFFIQGNAEYLMTSKQNTNIWEYTGGSSPSDDTSGLSAGSSTFGVAVGWASTVNAIRLYFQNEQLSGSGGDVSQPGTNGDMYSTTSSLSAQEIGLEYLRFVLGNWFVGGGVLMAKGNLSIKYTAKSGCSDCDSGTVQGDTPYTLGERAFFGYEVELGKHAFVDFEGGYQSLSFSSFTATADWLGQKGTSSWEIGGGNPIKQNTGTAFNGSPLSLNLTGPFAEISLGVVF